MSSKTKYLIAGGVVFALLWFGTRPEIALAMFGAPLLALGIGWAYERIFPHAFDPTIKVDNKPRAAKNAGIKTTDQRADENARGLVRS